MVSAGRGAIFGNFGFVKQQVFTLLVLCFCYFKNLKHMFVVLTSVNPRDVSKIIQNCNLAPDHSKKNQYDYLHITYSYNLLALLLIN